MQEDEGMKKGIKEGYRDEAVIQHKKISKRVEKEGENEEKYERGMGVVASWSTGYAGKIAIARHL
jgi:hypothetical protein